jgi:methionine biosynthesis protein MetW
MLIDGAGQSSDSLRYAQIIEAFDHSSHYGRLLQLVGRGKRVLELGSSTGYLTDAMQTHFDCQVVGVEIDANAAALSQSRGNRVLQLDLDVADLSDVLIGEKFDVVLCADVLEHLRHPEQVLRACNKLLRDDGRLVASIPNAAHADVRLALLGGQLPFRPMGLLDNTHIRFFTRSLVEQLFEYSGFRVISVARNRWGATKSEVSPNLGLTNQWLTRLLMQDIEAETYQFIVTGEKRRSADELKALREEESNALERVDIVVIENGYQKADDAYQRTLDLINYPPSRLRFWLASGAGVVSLERPLGKAPRFDSSDFRTFSFLPPGQCTNSSYDPYCSELVNEQNSLNDAVNVAAILKKIAGQSDAKFVFLLETSSLPGADCLYNLVRMARNYEAAGEAAALLAARPEASLGVTSQANSAGHISWHEFSGLLIPIENLSNLADFDLHLRTSLSQAQDMCFNAWATGLILREIGDATYFSNGSGGFCSNFNHQFLDGLRLRFRWGTRRNLLSYLRYVARTHGWLATLPKFLEVLCSTSKVFSTLPPSATNMIGFSGPGATHVGRINR